MSASRTPSKATNEQSHLGGAEHDDAYKHEEHSHEHTHADGIKHRHPHGHADHDHDHHDDDEPPITNDVR